jgi:hypothetical protein
MKLPCHSIITAGFGLLTTGLLHADLVLETETAQLGKQGEGLISTALQVERDKDGGTGYFTVNQFEVGLTDRSELLIEPFFYEVGQAQKRPFLQRCR